jgi:hypothetical protein
MALTTINGNFERHGRGELFLVPCPTADPGTGTLASTVDGYYGLFYEDPAAKKALKAGIKPWCNLTSDGIEFTCKEASVTSDPNNGVKHDIPVGIDEASLKLSFQDVDAPHLADGLGLPASQIIAVAAAAGKAGRKIAVLGGARSPVRYVAMYRMVSAQVPGEFDHYLFPRVSPKADGSIKLSKKELVKMDLTLQIQDDLYAKTEDGTGAIGFVDTSDAPAAQG